VEARFSAPVQAGPRTHPASSTEVVPGVKRHGRGADHPPAYSAEVKERVELHFYSTSEPSWPVKFTFTFVRIIFISLEIWYLNVLFLEKKKNKVDLSKTNCHIYLNC
jgi:hypothetical protein